MNEFNPNPVINEYFERVFSNADADTWLSDKADDLGWSDGQWRQTIDMIKDHDPRKYVNFQ